jgi:2'-5' RNA ligase
MNLLTNKRIQLTLFVNEKDSKVIEEVRSKFNPIQFRIIKSHVTLCREDELLGINKVITNIENLKFSPLQLNFDKPIRFDDGKGVFLPCLDENSLFQNLRKSILKGIIKNPRIANPHITLIHPRNATCTDVIFEEINKFSFPSQLTFNKISLIEQELGKEWKIIKDFDVL